MKNLLSYLRVPFLYLYHYLHPANIIYILRCSYFSSFSRKNRDEDLDLKSLPFINIYLLFISLFFSAILYFFLPFIGWAFHVTVALRVFGGFCAAFLLYVALGNMVTRLRKGEHAKADRGFAGLLVFFTVPGAVEGALLAGITGDGTLGMLVAGAEMALIPMAVAPMPAAAAASYGCIFGAIVSVFGLSLSRFQPPVRDWLFQLGAALVAILGLFIVLVVLTLAVSRVVRSGSSRFANSLFALSMLLTPTWLSFYLLQLIDTIHASRPSQVAMVLVYLIVVFRLPLWPLEVAWARLRFGSLLDRAKRWNEQRGRYFSTVVEIEQKAQPYRRAFRSAFFDRRIPLPLAGEQAALVTLASIDSALACEEAMELLRFSPRRAQAITALSTIAKQDPAGSFSSISELSRWGKEYISVAVSIAKSLDQVSSLIWQALAAVEAIDQPDLDSRQAGLSATDSSSAQIFFTQPMQSFLAGAREKFAAALAFLEQAAQDATPPRGTHLLLSILRQTHRELANHDAFAIAPIQVEQTAVSEFVNQLYDEQYYKWAIERIETRNWLARSMVTAATGTAVSQRRSALLHLLSDMSLGLPFLQLQFNRLLQEKAPGLWVLERAISVLQLHWRRLIAEAAEQLASQQPSGPIESPFILGPPVRGSLFMGRQRLMDQLKSLWGGQAQWQSILLHGHRRMGKSSILHNLPKLLSGHKVAVASLSIQELGEIAGAVDFLRPLARKIARATKDRFGDLPENWVELFDRYSPYEAFSEFMEQLGEKRGAFRLLITIDEYEGIDGMLKAGSIEATLLKFLRALLDRHSWLSFAFAGLHTHTELEQEHWQQLFRTVLSIPVSFLSQKDSEQLLTQPTEDFPVSYEPAVLQRAWELSAGQPFLLQLLGYSLLDRINQQRRARSNAPLLIKTSDLEEVLGDPEFYQRGAPYFDGVHRQVSDDQPEAAKVLEFLCSSEEGLDAATLAGVTQLPADKFHAALDLLLRHDVLRKQEPGGIVFAVELMKKYCQRLYRRPDPQPSETVVISG